MHEFSSSVNVLSCIPPLILMNVLKHLSRNRIGGTATHRPKSTSPTKVMDVRQLLEEKRQGLSQPREPLPTVASSGKTGELLNHM